MHTEAQEAGTACVQRQRLSTQRAAEAERSGQRHSCQRACILLRAYGTGTRTGCTGDILALPCLCHTRDTVGTSAAWARHVPSSTPGRPKDPQRPHKDAGPLTRARRLRKDRGPARTRPAVSQAPARLPDRLTAHLPRRLPHALLQRIVSQGTLSQAIPSQAIPSQGTLSQGTLSCRLWFIPGPSAHRARP